MPSVFPNVTIEYDKLRNDSGGLKTTVGFSILAASPLNALAVLEDETGVTKGSVYQSLYGETPDPPLICQEVLHVGGTRPAPIGGTGLYRFDAVFSQIDLKGTGVQTEPEPVAGGPKVYLWDASLYSGRATVNRDGTPITNTAGQSVSVPVEIAQASLVVLWYTSSFNASDVIRMAGSQNAVSWQGFEPGQAQCKRYRPREVQSGLVYNRAEFDARKIGWNPRPFNEGRQEWMASDTDGRPVYGANNRFGDSLASPRPLNGTGQFLDDWEEATTIETDLYEPIDYQALLGI